MGSESVRPDPRPWVLGVSSSHNGAACLLHGDEIAVAVQEERLTGHKRLRIAGGSPALCISYCLQTAGIRAQDLSAVCVAVQGKMSNAAHDPALNPLLQTGRNGVPTFLISHHRAHALGAFATSGFASSAVLVIDGLGSPAVDLDDDEARAVIHPEPDGWEIISLYHGEGTAVRPLEKHLVAGGHWIDHRDSLGMPSFASLGGIFSAVSALLFGQVMEAGKVMGLAPYGRTTIPVDAFFRIEGGRFVFDRAFRDRFPRSERWPMNREQYQDLAASAQAALEEAVLYLSRRARDLSASDRLCYAGGVALNSVANERIIRSSGFDELHIMPAAEDSGTAIGAAYHALWRLTNQNGRARMRSDATGRTYRAEEIDEAIAATPGVKILARGDAVRTTAELLAEGKLVGWFQGGSELGPRALGQRSILCDPRRSDAKEVLNERVKHREPFRPFAPVLPLEVVREWFDIDEGISAESPFMLRVASFRREVRDRVPAVVHVDGTGRLQTVTREHNGAFYDLVTTFGARTGVPMLLNTSMNVMGEPIVETPEDALFCLVSTGLDVCVLGDVVVEKDPALRSVLDLVPRLTVRSMTLQFPECADQLPHDPAIRSCRASFEVETPWGVATSTVPGNTVLGLRHVDGVRTGWELLRLVQTIMPIFPDEYARVLLGLRRRGILALRWVRERDVS